MKPISEKRNLNNKAVTFIWHPDKQLDLPVWQVYVFCVAKDNKVVLVRDKGEDRFTLPGGRAKA
jgi:ADP-ribose pyrophosphatase YjhB (NUDIX family)